MSREETIEHLGTIAKSGTAEFLARMTGRSEQDAQLIGQFGVGFYSSFIVADRVDVTRAAPMLIAEQGVHWQSTRRRRIQRRDRGACRSAARASCCTSRKASRISPMRYRIRSLVRKYSDHIAFPVRMRAENKSEQDTSRSRTKGLTQPRAYETVNHAQALWTRPRTEVKDEEYKEFYRHITHDVTDPLAWSHGKVEGKKEYTESAVRAGARAVRPVASRSGARSQAVRAARLHHGRRRQFLPLYLRFVKAWSTPPICR